MKTKRAMIILSIFLSIFLISSIHAYDLFPRPNINNTFFPNTYFVFNFTFLDDSNSVVFSNQSNFSTDSSGVAFTDLVLPIFSSVPTRFLHYRDSTLVVNKTFDDKIFNNVYMNYSLANILNITENLYVWGDSYFNGSLMPMTSLAWDIGSGPLRWRNIYATNLSIDNIDVLNDINILGDIIGPFGNFTELFAGDVNLTGLDNQFLNLSGTNANQNINISPYTLLAGGIILDDHSCLDFGSRATSICESGTDDIDIKSDGRIDIWTDNEISFRVDGDVNDYFHIETNANIPTLRSYLSNMKLSPDEGLVTITGNLTVEGNVTADWGLFDNLNVTGTSYLGNIIIEADNITTDNIIPLTSGGVVVWGNLTVDEYISGQPIDGSLGSGIINSSNNNLHCGCVNASDQGGLNVKYPDMIVRIWNYGDVKYCDISGNTIAVPDDAHTVYYVDSDCAVQTMTWTNYFAQDINPPNYVRIFDVYTVNGDIEVLKGGGVLGLFNKKNKFESVNCGRGGHLSICDGMTILESDTFPELNMSSGHMNYIKTVQTTQARNSNPDGIHITCYSDGSHTAETEIDIDKCDNGVSCDACPTNKYRRYIIYNIGWGDHTEIHQLVPLDDDTYTTLANCIDTTKNPLSYTLPSDEDGVTNILAFYCGKRDDTAWANGLVDLRLGRQGFGASPDLGEFVTYNEASQNVDLGDKNITADTFFGDWNGTSYYLSDHPHQDVTTTASPTFSNIVATNSIQGQSASITDYLTAGSIRLEGTKISTPSNNLDIDVGGYWINFSGGSGTEINTLSDTFTFTDGSIVASSGAIDFDNENLITTGNITADYFFGNGSQLTGINGGGADYQFGSNNFNGSGNFTTTGNVNLSILNLPVTTSSVGIINQNGIPIFHTFGGGNIFIGKNAGNFASTGGSGNVAIGELAMGDASTTALSNFALGYNSLNDLTTGDYNVCIGSQAGKKTKNGVKNIFIGETAGYSNVAGQDNVKIGVNSGWYGTGNKNIFLGYRSGYRQTTEYYRLIISSLEEPTKTDEASGSIIYGVMNDDRDSQDLTFNADVGIYTNSQVYPFEVNKYSGDSDISIYALGNVSATGFITRTSVFDKKKGNALDFIQDSNYYKKGDKIDHTKFYGYAGEFEVTDYTKPNITYYPCSEVDEKTGESYLTGDTCSDVNFPYKKIEEGVSLDSEIDVLRQGLYELKQENELFKIELCKLGSEKYKMEGYC